MILVNDFSLSRDLRPRDRRTPKGSVIEGSFDFMGGKPSWKVTTLPSLVSIRIVIV